MGLILGGALGECVHVAGVLNFLRLAEAQGYRTEFLGAAVPVEEFIGAIQETDPEIVAVSYRLTPETGAALLAEFKSALVEAGLTHKRFCFGGTPPVAAMARKLGLFEAAFSGEEPLENVIAYLKGQDVEHRTAADYPTELVERIAGKSPFPVIRHHFGLPADSIEPTVTGIRQIAAAEVLDVISLGPDQDAQENFFHPERCDPSRRGAGGVPVRTEDDFRALYAATRRGNYPLLRSYSGTNDLLRYAQMLRETINNAWCATSTFWFNVLDRRGPIPLTESIAEHFRLMAWHGERGIPVEGNESHHWELRDAHDAVAVATSYISAYAAKQMGVLDYISPYMFNTPPQLSDKMDLAKMLAKAELTESLQDEHFRVYRQTRTGLLSYPVDPDYAKGQLAASVYLQMAMQPQIIHVVASCEADHAAKVEDVVESCKIARKVIQNCLYGMPDLTADPSIQARKLVLMAEAKELLGAIRKMGARTADPLVDPATLARAVTLGLLDAPQLKGNPHACGQVVTRIIDGANFAVDPDTGRVLTEAERIASFASPGKIAR